MDIKSFFWFLVFFTAVAFYSLAQEDSSYVRSEKDTSIPSKKFADQSKEDGSFFKKENIFVGFYPGFQFSNVDFFVEFSPIVGYRILPKLSAGLGGIYRYYKVREPYYTPYGVVLPYQSNVYGVRGFASFDVYKGFLAYAEYEGVSYEMIEPNFGRYRRWAPAFKAGAGYSSPLGERAAVNMLVLYNFSFEENTAAASSPWDFRVGFIFFPFRSKSY